MGTIVDRATAAAQAEVCSLYLLDRDGTGVTLAATNGLDPEQIGVARLPLGVGITGIVAKTRQPATSLNVHKDERFHWIRGVDEPQVQVDVLGAADLERPGRRSLNVQTIRRRAFTKQDVSFLEALAGLMAGIVERNRLQREAEDQIESLRAIDEARAHLVAVVTHALRTPLAVVRAYVELLGGATKRLSGRDEASEASTWERNALEQVDRLDQTIDSILASLRVLQSDSGPVVTLDMAEVVEDTAKRARAAVSTPAPRGDVRGATAARPRVARHAPPVARLPVGERRQVRARGGQDRYLRLARGRPHLPGHHRRWAGYPG